MELGLSQVVKPDSYVRADGRLVESLLSASSQPAQCSEDSEIQAPMNNLACQTNVRIWILANYVILAVIHVTFLLRASRPRVRNKGKTQYQLRGLCRLKEETNQMELVWTLLTWLQGQRILNLPLAWPSSAAFGFPFRYSNDK